jgi:hypothetical protein
MDQPKQYKKNNKEDNNSIFSDLFNYGQVNNHEENGNRYLDMSLNELLSNGVNNLKERIELLSTKMQKREA